MNDYLIKRKLHLDNKTKAMIELLRESVKTEGDCIKLSADDSKEFFRVLDGVIFLLVEYSNFIDYLGKHTGSAGANMLLAIRDKQITEDEKMNALNTLLCNLIEWLPEDWREYFQLKLNSITDETKLGKSSNPVNS